MICNSINRDVDRGKRIEEDKRIIVKEICLRETNSKKEAKKRKDNGRNGNRYKKTVNRQR